MTTEDLAIADRALRDGDVRHAIAHLAQAFATAPADEKLHALLETAAQRGDVLAALPDDHFAGTELIRAWALRRAGRVSEAVVLLAQVVEAVTDGGFETVLAAWLSVAAASGAALTAAARGQVTRVLARMTDGTVGFHRLPAGARALLDGYVQLALALEPFAGDFPARQLLVEAVDDLVPHTCEPRFIPLAAALDLLPAVPETARAKLRAWEQENLSVAPAAPTAPAAPAASAAPATSDEEEWSPTGPPLAWKGPLLAFVLIMAFVLLAMSR